MVMMEKDTIPDMGTTTVTMETIKIQKVWTNATEVPYHLIQCAVKTTNIKNVRVSKAVKTSEVYIDNIIYVNSI